MERPVPGGYGSLLSTHSHHAVVHAAPSRPHRRSARELPLKNDSLELKSDWHYEESGQRQHYLIEARVDGRVRGRAHGWFEPGGKFVLEKIEMDPAQRSRGHGSALIARLREKAREKHCTELVFKGVRASNGGAIRLYESMGAVPVRTSEALVDYVIAPP